MANTLTQNLERYKNCFCNKESGNNIVELNDYPQEKIIVSNIFQQQVMFVISGSVQVSMEGLGTSRRLKKGEFAFFPAGSRVACEFAKESSVLVVRIDSDVPECPIFRVAKPTMSKIMDFREHAGIHALKANKRIRAFMAELIETVNDGFLCRHFLQGEAQRLLFLMNAYYSDDDRTKFFSHILTPDIKFSEFVRMNYMKYRTISELSNVLCMTSQAFSNRFKKVFGMTPHKWMQQEKARQIYLDICRTDMPLKEIAIKYDFPLSSNFFRFCKQTFGESPGNIRKSLNKNLVN